MRHEHVVGPLGELRQIGTPSSGPAGILHHPPEACDRGEVVPAMGGENMDTSWAIIVIEGGSELVCPMDSAALDAQHDVLAGLAEDRPPLMELVAARLSITRRHAF